MKLAYVAGALALTLAQSASAQPVGGPPPVVLKSVTSQFLGNRPLEGQSYDLKFGPSLTPANNCPAGPTGTRRQATQVRFSPPFSGIPVVTASLNEIDGGDQRNLRVRTYATNVTREAATVVLETWCNTNLYGAGVTLSVLGTR